MSDLLSDIPREKLPRHIAIIMDGNGRWATQRGLDRSKGHAAGAKTVRTVVTECARMQKHLGAPDFLTLYSFSVENWKRPVEEVTFLMEMYVQKLQEERPTMMENNVRLRHIGRLDQLPDPVIEELRAGEEETKNNNGLTLVLALNYGSRAEITDAMKEIAQEIKDNTLNVRDINEELVAQHLYTAGMPDPDLMIRTASELRVSNFLLWQISYAELFVCDALWPDFSAENLHEAIRAYSMRNRRFGALSKKG